MNALILFLVSTYTQNLMIPVLSTDNSLSLFVVAVVDAVALTEAVAVAVVAAVIAIVVVCNMVACTSLA
ncbi:hypothetical protein SAMD00019534_085290 [Acytostelium subglobosum LB1]|uniref:hypothetical protein n=1 Tax=Acytostelium subglobosum LB1 TaxID=1410327 RepID=UPI0006448DBE|nr:hypothetical protein SAMD00019534_085290 [Acytostelium subglobosum LB1]GAM25354.1 hypothetical protein SAMD00019534_085290 [Acytostelium subglobosum LB1]|eukprot:XP_012751874.1 hypothetical protein SAMD00019534_085290 [Acytostelium subglobosum LB1]